jgi:hypothetical protein
MLRLIMTLSKGKTTNGSSSRPSEARAGSAKRQAIQFATILDLITLRSSPAAEALKTLENIYHKVMAGLDPAIQSLI